MISALGCRYFRRAFGWCVPIGGLGGLIGLGGGEFRLPLLIYGIGFDARSAVPLNLLISLLTLTFALIARSQTIKIGGVAPLSLGIVMAGLVRYWRAGAIPIGNGPQRLTAAMAAGSIAGATPGGLGLAFAPAAFLKVFLGGVLLAAAWKTVFHK